MVIGEENHFRKLLMLFTGWRVKCDLIKLAFSNKVSRITNQIESQMKQYAASQEALEQADQSFEMNDENDAWDLIAPTTQHSTQQDSVQCFTEKEPDVVDSYNFSEDLHILSTHIENQTMLNEQPDEEYHAATCFLL